MRKPLSLIAGFVRDRRANVAIEFAFIVPLMLTMFFGMVEFSSGIAVNRKVTLAARNMSDLVSQSSTVTDTDLANSPPPPRRSCRHFGGREPRSNSTVSPALCSDPATLQRAR